MLCQRFMALRDRKKSKNNIWLALRSREETGNRHEEHRKNNGIEKRCSYGLDDLVGLDHPAASSVIMGFSAGGEHLISYACHCVDGEADSFGELGNYEYVLEFWRFNFHTPLICTGRIPLFRCSDGTKFDTSEFDECAHAKICVVESLVPSVMLVSGCGSNQDLIENESQPSRRESISVLMGYTGCMNSFPETDILVLHLTYLKRPPYPPLQLTHCLVSCGDGESSLPLSIVLNTGDTIRVVTVLDKRDTRTHKAFGNEHDLEVRIEHLTSRGDEEEWDNVIIVQGCFDAEEYLSQLISTLKSSGQLPHGNYSLVDYDLTVVEASGDSFRSAGLTGAVLGDLLRRADGGLPGNVEEQSQTPTTFEEAEDHDIPGAGGVEDRAPGSRQQDQQRANCVRACAAVGLVVVLQGTPGSSRAHVMLGQLFLLDLTSGAIIHRMSTCIQPCHPDVLTPPSRLVMRFAASWQAALHQNTLQSHRLRNLLFLDNDALQCGKCLPVLPNRRYPVDITPPS